ncbi:PucR family transcriptional regulator [Streptomyces sp. NPDC091279]|uniref:PucR family transcriptional regulator n=1 Tax=Streptomyces sp. NPDC091279 TaxID=3365983 RepID=UPI003823F6D9
MSDATAPDLVGVPRPDGTTGSTAASPVTSPAGSPLGSPTDGSADSSGNGSGDPLDAAIAHYARMLLNTAVAGTPPSAADTRVGRALGRACARSAVPLHLVVKHCTAEATDICYRLSRLQHDQHHHGPPGLRHDPAAALRVASERALAALISGYEDDDPGAPGPDDRSRAWFLVDLLADRIPAYELAGRAAQVGFPLGVEFAVVVTGGQSRPAVEQVVRALQNVGRAPGARTCLVAPYEDTVVALVPTAPSTGSAACRAVARSVERALRPVRQHAPGLRIALGRPRAGGPGLRASYQEACEALEFGLHTGADALDPYASDLLLRRVLVRDHTAIRDLVASVLTPLTKARQGPAPLLDTLETYFAVGCTSTRAAEALHLSVRAVTYRLARVQALTGHDVNVPAQRFVLEAALRGARALNWPQRPLPED